MTQSGWRSGRTGRSRLGDRVDGGVLGLKGLARWVLRIGISGVYGVPLIVLGANNGRGGVIGGEGLL